MAAMLITGKTRCRSHLPEANLFDIPELMPGAQSSATASERMDFEQRCMQLYTGDVEEKGVAVAAVPARQATAEQLESMFPNLDPVLVRALAADATTPQQAMETLLALSAATAEPASVPLPPRDVGLEDIDAFPSLVDADGWQVCSQQLFDRNPEADLGSAWRDRAKAIASTPAPCPVAKPANPLAIRQKRASKQDDGASPETVHVETEYELRHRLGKQRISNRVRFPGKKANALSTNPDPIYCSNGAADGEEEHASAVHECGHVDVEGICQDDGM